MKCNVATWDRLLRLFFGFLITTWAFAGGPWWSYLGLALLASGAWRLCPVYTIMRTGTYK